MNLSNLLNPRFIALHISADSRTEVIGLLLDKMFVDYQFPLSRQQVESAIAAREALKGTIFGSGLSIPHARIDLFDDLLIGVASMSTPIHEDGIDVSLVVLILTSRTTSNLYLNCLSAFTRISRNKEFMARIGTADQPQAFIDIVHALEIEVKPELTVEDIMNREFPMVLANTPIRSVIDLMCESDVSFVTVANNEGDFLGEIGAQEVMALGIPNYAQLVGNSSHLKAFEPMEALLAKEDTLTAQHVMHEPTNTFSPQTSIVEAVFAFSKTGRRNIPVVENQKIVGLVSNMDVLKKVLRG